MIAIDVVLPRVGACFCLLFAQIGMEQYRAQMGSLATTVVMASAVTNACFCFGVQIPRAQLMKTAAQTLTLPAAFVVQGISGFSDHHLTGCGWPFIPNYSC